MRCFIILLVIFVIVSTGVNGAFAAGEGWYTEGDNAHKTRIKITLINTLDFDREECPIVIPREDLPIRDIHEMAVTVVDPSLPARPMPSTGWSVR